VLGAVERGSLGRPPERFWTSIDEYLDMEHEEVGIPLVPGLLYRRTRVVLVSHAKVGKSVVSRQFAFCVSQGLHPFRLTPTMPLRVLTIDCENDDDELVISGRRQPRHLGAVEPVEAVAPLGPLRH
jgi:hypothetical protein